MNPKFGLLNQADPGLDKNATSHNRNQSQLNTSAFSQMYPNLPGTGSIRSGSHMNQASTMPVTSQSKSRSLLYPQLNPTGLG